MKSFIQLLSIMSGVFLINLSAYSQVIDLENRSPDKCRQQLLSAKDSAPVILEYGAHCGPSKHFMPIYEQFAAQHPEKTFFRIEVESAGPFIFPICLQDNGVWAVPKIAIIEKYLTPKGPLITTQLRSNIGGNLTSSDLDNLIAGFSSNNSIRPNITIKK
jgi:thiol-disulfide isomerase/thioredoxin